jgi:hypothetical protein
MQQFEHQEHKLTQSFFVKILENTFSGMPKVRAWPIFTLSMLSVKT